MWNQRSWARWTLLRLALLACPSRVQAAAWAAKIHGRKRSSTASTKSPNASQKPMQAKSWHFGELRGLAQQAVPPCGKHNTSQTEMLQAVLDKVGRKVLPPPALKTSILHGRPSERCCRSAFQVAGGIDHDMSGSKVCTTPGLKK